MLIRISETMAINTQQVIRIYVKKVFDGYEVIGETLDHLYTIKKCTTRAKAGETLEKILSQYDRGQRIIEL